MSILEEITKNRANINIFKYQRQKNKDELLIEISYLRATLASNIRQKRRVKSADSSKAYQYKHFTEEELRIGIGNILLTVNSIWGGGTTPPNRKKNCEKNGKCNQDDFLLVLLKSS